MESLLQNQQLADGLGYLLPFLLGLVLPQAPVLKWLKLLAGFLARVLK